jgi:ATP-binding cassette subfamily B protein/subfamily B ATP-binding cassette protein MsbA
LKNLVLVFRYARRYAKYTAVALVCMIGLVGVQLIGPQIIRRLVELVTAGTWDAVARQQVTTLSLGILGVYALRMFMRFGSNYMQHVAGWGVVADVRRHIYSHLQRLSMRFYEDQQVGELMSRMVNDSDKFESLISHAIPDTLVSVLMLIGVVSVMVSMNWQLMLLTVVPIPLIILALKGFGKYVRPAFRERQKELGELNATLNDNLSGIREIKAFTREELEQVRIGTHIDRYRVSMLRALRLMAIFGPFTEFSSSLGTVIVIFFGGMLAFQGILPIQDLVAFFLYLNLFYQPVQQLTNVWEQFQEALAASDRVFELLNRQPDVDDKPGAAALLDRVRGEVELHDVSFAYHREQRVLEHISLRVAPGSMVALVGPTGVGKSTLASLLPRFYDVVAGAVLIDGHDVRDVTLASLRKQISIVLQDVFLFHGTVRENILFGRPNATEEELIEATRVANAYGFIQALPQGLDTMIGERGVKLSGGQKQRLSIARAVLKDAPILILDEATSSVDTETEMLIQEALERLMRGRTTLVIAHRLSTVRRADTIVVLEGAGILEQGTHEQLMAHDGLYRHLWDIQSRMVPDSNGERVPAFSAN